MNTNQATGTTINFVDELRWRGMLQDMMPGTEQLLTEGSVAAYIGFDPTAASLHIGNLATLMLLVHLQRAGHKPVALVGGATGMIGDPSGKSSERNLLSEDILRQNQEGIRTQLAKFLDFEAEPNKAVLVNNYDWFKGISFLDFLRQVGKHLTVNYMLKKDSVKKRIGVASDENDAENAEGISFTEFSYQLLQGYDFYYLYKHYNCKLQMGGSDQWGNITSGTELIRRMDGGKAFALTCPLLTKADGSKFGKSEGGNIWLDPNLTSPYKFYQFWLNSTDADSGRLLRVFTLLSQAEIENLEQEHAQAPHLRIMQKALAKEVTCLVHSITDWEQAVSASEILFGKGTTEMLSELSEQMLLSVLEGVPTVRITNQTFTEAGAVSALLSELTNYEIFDSKGEAKKMIKAGGVSINKQKIADDLPVSTPLLLDKYLIIQKGKKNYFLIVIEN